MKHLLTASITFVLSLFCFTSSTGQTFSSNPGSPISATQPALDEIVVSSPGRVGKLTAYVHITHTYVGDLLVRLSHLETGKTIDLISAPGGGFCFQNNINVTFDDDVSIEANDECNATPPAIGGVARPVEMLSIFNGDLISGTWRITVADSDQSDDGILQSWALNFTNSDIPLDVYMNTFSDSVRLHWNTSTLEDLSGYAIYRSVNNEPENLLTTNGTDTSYVDNTVDNQTNYTYRVKALSSGGSESDYSEPDQGTPSSNFDRAAVFSGNDDVITIPSRPILERPRGTIEFWVKIDESPAGKNNGFYMLANKLDDSGFNGWTFYHDESELVAQMKNETGSITDLASNLNLIDSRWHHVAMSYDFSGGQQTVLYVDGAQVANSSITLDLTTEPILIGEGKGTFWTDFEGSLDEFRIWQQAKTVGEIDASRTTRANGSEEGLILVFNMDEPIGNSLANDGSPRNLNGVVSGVEFEEQERPIIPVLSYITPPDFERGFPGLTNSFSLPANIFVTGDLEFSPSGSRMFIVERSEGQIHQFDLSTSFDPATASFSGVLDVSPSEHLEQGITFDGDGTRLFLLGTNSTIYQYDLSTPFDITSAVYANINNTLGINFTRDLVFGNNGNRLFLLISSAIYQFSMTTPYDISSITADNLFIDIGTENQATSLTLSTEGHRIFTTGTSQDEIIQINLKEPFDLTGATKFSALNYFLEEESVPTGLSLNPQGNKMFLIGDMGKTVFTYNFDENTFIESPLDDGNVRGVGIISISGDTFADAGGILVYDEDYTMSNLPSGLSPVLNINNQGNTAELSFVLPADDNSPLNSISSLNITFENSAFVKSNAGEIQNAINAESNFGIKFIGDQPFVFTSVDSTGVLENTSDLVLDVQAIQGSVTPDEGITYSLGFGLDADLFVINEETGLLFFSVPPDFEIPQDADFDNLHELTVIADNGTEQATQSIKIQVLDVNDNFPEIVPGQVLSIQENSPVTTNVGVIEASDPDVSDNLQGWFIVDPDPTLPFEIDAEGQIILTAAINFEAVDSYEFTVAVSDGINITQETVVVEVLNINEVPIASRTIDDLKLKEGFGDYTIELTGLFTDPDMDDFTLSATSINDRVAIVDATSSVLNITEVGIGTSLIIVRASDAELAGETTFTLTIVPDGTNDIPVLAVNNGLQLEQAQSLVISNAMLLTTDTDNALEEIEYTISTGPSSGSLLLKNTMLTAGETFTQEDVNNGLVSYAHNGRNSESDIIVFDISDGAGGVITGVEFSIVIDIILSIGEINPEVFKVYPVPFQHEMTIQIRDDYYGPFTISILSPSGQGLWHRSFEKQLSEFQYTVNATKLPLGMNYLKIQYQNDTRIIKIIKQ